MMLIKSEGMLNRRFNRYLLLAVAILVISVPTVIAVMLGVRMHEIKREDEGQIEQLRQQNRELTDKLERLEDWQRNGFCLDADCPKYQSLYPDFYAPQDLDATVVNEKTAYLTFDERPSDNTDIILQTLQEENVKATFFVVGNSGEKNLARMRRMVQEGHTIGMHSYSHVYSEIYGSVEAYLDDMYRVFKLIRDTTGVTPSCFRFPGGSLNAYNAAVHKEIMAEMLRRGFVPFDWNVSSEDASGEEYSPEQLAQNVVKGIYGCKRGIILMHDGAQKKNTARAVRQIIRDVRSEGYSFEALDYQVKPILFCYKE